MIRTTAAALLFALLARGAAASDLHVRAPEAGPAVRVAKTRTMAVPGDTSLFARSGFDLLVIPPGKLEPETFARRGPLLRMRGGALERLRGLWSIAGTGSEPRAPYGERNPFVVLERSGSVGYGTEQLRAISLHALLSGAGEEKAIELPTGLRSPLLVRSGIRLLVTGYTYDEKEDRVAMQPPGRGREQAQNLVVYDIAGGKPLMLAMIERFTEHAENNLASAATTDGVLHMIAAEVLVTEDNRSRVHHLRFDPVRRAWLESRVLFERSEFTSTLTPQIVASGNTVDAFWHADGGATRGETDGLYAHRAGETTVWRLHDADGEYALLPNADGRGALLAGVATTPSEGGTVRWFLRGGAGWRSAGETDFGRTLYTLTTIGTEPFSLWRDADGAVHAAFTGPDGLVIADLELPN